MPGATITLDEAQNLTRTGDIWLFRGHSMADRAIRMTTNSPVNHVGMSVVLDDLPPLMWHAELGRSLPDMWSGMHQRGVQLHDLRAAVLVWARKYGQQAWLRQLDVPVTREMEDAMLRTIARLDGTPFPSSARMMARWLRGRVPTRLGVRDALSALRQTRGRRWSLPGGVGRAGGVGEAGGTGGVGRSGSRGDGPGVDLETAYCAEVIAVTYEAMGLLPTGRRSSWYDAGRFWSGDELPLVEGAQLSGEIAVQIPGDSAPRQ